jgi:hypothetical protein
VCDETEEVSLISSVREVLPKRREAGVVCLISLLMDM